MVTGLVRLLFNDGILTVVAWSLILVLVIPVAVIVRRTGHSLWWLLILAVPLGGFIGLWLLAISKWPVLGETRS
jgi:hypothetical protein